MDVECNECQKTEAEVKLQKCPICFKYFCDEHAYHRSGLWFCSKGCAEYFFFSEPDD